MSAVAVRRAPLIPVATHPRRRLAWSALALLALGAAALAAAARGDLWIVVVFAIAPDLSFLAGLGQRTAHGQLARRAVPVYNLVHRPLLPLAFAAVAALGLLPAWCAVAGLAWLGHISVDRAVGYRLRTRDGWQRA
jgi:hypothetical protein